MVHKVVGAIVKNNDTNSRDYNNHSNLNKPWKTLGKTT